MTELQVRLLEMLKEIDSLCRANDIEFYLAAGTAIGAIRHHGFIPWDDDADIYMTRDNWEKFFSIREQLPKERCLVSCEQDYSSGYTINRYVDMSTTRLYRYLCASPQPGGVIIDILVLDPVDDSEECVKDYVVSLTEYANQLVKATTHSQRCPYRTHPLKYWLLSKIIGRDRVLDKLKQRILKYEDKGPGYYIQRDPIVPHVWRREAFGKPYYVPFEDTMMPVAERYYEQLCGAFNEEWMYVPNVIDREEHMKSVNLNISNNNAFEDYKKLVDLKEVDKIYMKRQQSGNMLGETRKKLWWKRLEYVSVKLQLKYENANMKELYSLFEAGEFEKLEEYFADYSTVQGNKMLVGSPSIHDWLRLKQPYYIDLGDDFLYIFLRTLMHKGMLAKANSILTAREAQRTSSNQIAELRNMIDTIKESCSLMQFKEYQKVYEKTDGYLKKYPENIFFKRLWFASRYFMANEQEELLLEEELQKEEYDCVLSCILCEILFKRGEYETVLEKYSHIIEETTHGLVLFHIQSNLEKLQEREEFLEKVNSELLKVRMRLGAEEAEVDDEEKED